MGGPATATAVVAGSLHEQVRTTTKEQKLMAVTAKETVVPFVIEGTGTGVAQKVVVPGSDHAFETDAYPAFGGQDAAPSPLFFLLGALSSCNQVTA